MKVLIFFTGSFQNETGLDSIYEVLVKETGKESKVLQQLKNGNSYVYF